MKMRENVNFSVIIPHKNIPSLLCRCLDSIPNRKDIQIIVVDDNSDSGSVNFEEFPGINRENVQVILTKEGKGAGYARNVGLSYAVGKWLIFADADDFFSSDFLSLIDYYKDHEEDIIYFNIDSVYSSDLSRKANRSEHKEKLFRMNENSPEEGELFFRYNYPEPWGKMVRRSVVFENQIYFDETFICNDLLFSTKVGHCAKTILAVDKVLYIVTLREDSLTNNTVGDFNKLIGRIKATTKAYLYLKERNISYKINPLRGPMVIVIKNHPLKFIKTLGVVKDNGVNILPLIKEIFDYRLFSKK